MNSYDRFPFSRVVYPDMFSYECMLIHYYPPVHFVPTFWRDFKIGLSHRAELWHAAFAERFTVARRQSRIFLRAKHTAVSTIRWHQKTVRSQSNASLRNEEN